MKIAFISIVKDPWGGSEGLWAHAGREAMEQGYEVFISAYNRGSISSQFKSLADAGATLFFRRGYIPPGMGLYRRVFKKGLNFLSIKIIREHGHRP